MVSEKIIIIFLFMVNNVKNKWPLTIFAFCNFEYFKVVHFLGLSPWDHLGIKLRLIKVLPYHLVNVHDRLSPRINSLEPSHPYPLEPSSIGCGEILNPHKVGCIPIAIRSDFIVVLHNERGSERKIALW